MLGNSIQQGKSNNKLKYEIKLDDNGKVLSYIISDSNYCIDSNKNINSITLDDITISATSSYSNVLILIY